MIDVKPISGTLGAEITGVDLAQKLPTKIHENLRHLLIEYQVIFFRNQKINHAQFKAFAETFGPLQSHPAYKTVEGYPQITILESTPDKPTKIEEWHSDMTFLLHPPLGTVLQAKVIPPKGGDTLWSSMTAAYDGLSPSMQSFLSNLKAEHDFSWGFKETLSEPGGREKLSQAIADNPPVIHPVIQTHPESEKKVIFVNSLFTTRIVGLNKNESCALLNALYEHIRKPEFTCRFHWEVNSIAVWDNRSTQHKPINDYFPGYRKLERITITGDKPY